MIILDDFHFVEHSQSIQEWCQWFISHLPQGAHLVIASRVRPAWDLLTTLKVRGNLLELTEKELAFSEEEIEVLFADYYEQPLEPNQVKKIYALTEGWVIAIQMISQQLNDQEDLEKILANKTHFWMN